MSTFSCFYFSHNPKEISCLFYRSFLEVSLKFYRSLYGSVVCVFLRFFKVFFIFIKVLPKFFVIFWVIFSRILYLHLQFKLHLYINVTSFLSQIYFSHNPKEISCLFYRSFLKVSLKFYRSLYGSVVCVFSRFFKVFFILIKVLPKFFVIFWVIFSRILYLHLQFKLHLYINVTSFLSQMFF